MNDLSLISIQDLVDELSKRFDSGIFYSVRIERKGEETCDRFWWHYFGGKSTCIGLCELMKKHILDDCDSKKDLAPEDF